MVGGDQGGSDGPSSDSGEAETILEMPAISRAEPNAVLDYSKMRSPSGAEPPPRAPSRGSPRQPSGPRPPISPTRSERTPAPSSNSGDAMTLLNLRFTDDMAPAAAPVAIEPKVTLPSGEQVVQVVIGNPLQPGGGGGEDSLELAHPVRARAGSLAPRSASVRGSSVPPRSGSLPRNPSLTPRGSVPPRSGPASFPPAPAPQKDDKIWILAAVMVAVAAGLLLALLMRV